MNTYDYTAKERNKKLVKGSVKAESRYEVMAQLKHAGLTVISLTEFTPKQSAAKKKDTPAAAEKKRLFALNLVSKRELAIFTRQLSVSINAGVTLIESLHSIADDIDNPYFKKILCEAIEDIKAGSSFSQAMAKHKKAVGTLFVALIRSAEESGSLAQVLEYIAAYLEKSVSLDLKIRSITAYPIFVAVFFSLVVLIATLFIIPRFQGIFSSFDAEIPLITQIVFNLNTFILKNFALLLAVIIGIALGIFLYGRNPKGRYKIDEWKLRIPIFGKLIRKSSIARFTRVLAVMLRGGVPIGIALDVTSEVCGNKVLESALQRTKARIMEGAQLATCLDDEGVFPRFVVRMVAVGEASGQLPDVLEKVSDMYEDQIEAAIMVTTSLFEPSIILVFGVFVLVLILSIYVPIFKVASSIR